MIVSAQEALNMTYPKLVRLNYMKRRGREALRKKNLGIWQTYTWEDLYLKVKYIFLGLKSLGLSRGDRVCIFAEGDPEWYIAQFAAETGGAAVVGIISDCLAKEAQYQIDYSEAKFVFVDDQEQVDKMLEIRGQVSKIQKVIYWDPKGMWSYDDDWLICFEEVLRLGRDYEVSHPSLFDEEIDAGKPEDIALFIFSSGTTGLPKAAQLSYRGFVHNYVNIHAEGLPSAHDEGDKVMSMHFPGIAEQYEYVPGLLLSGVIVCFPEGSETAAANAREVAPASVLYIARMYQDLAASIRAKIEDSSFIQRLCYEASVAVGYKLLEFEEARVSPPMFWKILGLVTDWMATRQIRDNFGLLYTKTAWTSGAGIGPELFRFVRALRINLLQMYGTVEMHGPCTIQSPNIVSYGACGVPIAGVEIRITDESEGLIRGPTVFSGYYKRPEATAKEGWWHSGDTVHLTEDGQLVVLGRLAEMMKLESGEPFSPVFIENSLNFSPYISDSMILGDGRNFVTAIVVLDFTNAGLWAERKGITYTTLTDLSQKPQVYDLIEGEIERVNRLLPSPVRIRRFINFYKLFDPDEGELTRTRKLRRGFLKKQYKDLAEGLYGTQYQIKIDSEIVYHDGRRSKLQVDLPIRNVLGD